MDWHSIYWMYIDEWIFSAIRYAWRRWKYKPKNQIITLALKPSQQCQKDLRISDMLQSKRFINREDSKGEMKKKKTQKNTYKTKYNKNCIYKHQIHIFCFHLFTFFTFFVFSCENDLLTLARTCYKISASVHLILVYVNIVWCSFKSLAINWRAEANGESKRISHCQKRINVEKKKKIMNKNNLTTAIVRINTPTANTHTYAEREKHTDRVHCQC